MSRVADLNHILDTDDWVRRKGYGEEEFAKAARALFGRQFLFGYDTYTKSAYELVNRYTPYFSELAWAFGYSLVDESNTSRMIGIVPKLEDGRRRLGKDETIMLLVLACAYHERVTAGDVGDFGVVETDHHDLGFNYGTMTKMEPPSKGDLRQYLQRFKQSGLIGFEETEEAIIVTIRPSILHAVGKDYLERLQRFAGGAEVTDDPETEESDELPSPTTLETKSEKAVTDESK